MADSRMLIVEDDDVIRTFLRDVLTRDGYRVVEASDGTEAIGLIERQQFDIVVTDIVMPGVTGNEVVRAAKLSDANMPVIVITGLPSIRNTVILAQLGATDFISKPFDITVMRNTIKKVLATRDRAPRMPTRPATVAFSLEYNEEGVHDAATFAQLLADVVEWCEWEGYSCAVVMIEVDNMAAASAAAGGATADDVLRALIWILKNDVGTAGTASATGPNRLGVVLRRTEHDAARRIAYGFREKVASDINVSAEIACYPRDGDSADALLKLTETALKAAKDRGGDTVLFRRVAATG